MDETNNQMPPVTIPQTPHPLTPPPPTLANEPIVISAQPHQTLNFFLTVLVVLLVLANIAVIGFIVASKMNLLRF